ncbi:Nuclear transport factor 2 (NTF2) family protein [Quillaja saponaria]|uniref:Nuclear transport factor 2 (NTF2) family protein n=1 Tax=Quillaja saponaria TaxID=32244 RepID=A0AAD7QAS3_QUISA|nr:Nuclear transport factor 2 (NTF2) family protein [Quillaja saponaria]
MERIYCNARAPLPLTFIPKRIHSIRCCSNTPDSNTSSSSPATTRPSYKRETPQTQILKIAVSGVTELLRLFSPANKNSNLSREIQDEISVSSVDDVLRILTSDYENAYFVTGNFTSEIYADDCTFEDPTITFRGRELYSRNLKLLLPFFDCPSIGLRAIVKDISSETNFVLATWKLRTYLKLPWRPLIAIDGSTIYELDEDFKIVRHAESWNVSALEAIGQIFTFGSGSSGG